MFPFEHSPHDYDYLLNQWRDLATNCGLIEHPLDQSTSAFHTEAVDNAYYISAGVHGDECAPVWALLEWATEHQQWIQTNPIILFPCFNPEGFRLNERTDKEGRDLNRHFQDSTIPVIAAWHKLIANKRFCRSLHLHEDYDARGIYLYEVAKHIGLGRAILDRCQDIIPVETQTNIDGCEFDRGLTSHEPTLLIELIDSLLDGGYPEAIYLNLNHCDTSITFETPSELDLSMRIKTHRQAIDCFLE